jgi:hypothetical protein
LTFGPAYCILIDADLSGGGASMQRTLVVGLLSALLALAAPAAAETAPEEALSDEMTEKQRRAVELAREATEMLMKALDLFLQSIPQYGPPEIDEHGNIVIPRIPPQEAPEPGPEAPAGEGDAPLETAI